MARLVKVSDRFDCPNVDGEFRCKEAVLSGTRWCSREKAAAVRGSAVAAAAVIQAAAIAMVQGVAMTERHGL